MSVLPWYERGPDGTWTGREWATDTEARAEVAPGCTVHVELSAVVEPASFRRATHTHRVSDVVSRPWKPRGYGGTD